MWAACDSFAATPKNNKEASLAEMQAEMELVKDALEEVEEVVVYSIDIYLQYPYLMVWLLNHLVSSSLK